MASPKARLRTILATLGFAFAFGLASPALAETATLSCEGQLTNFMNGQPFNDSVPWHTSIDLDYASSKITIMHYGDIAQGTAAITDKEIRFDFTSYRSSGRAWARDTGVLDRLAGTLELSTSYFEGGGGAINLQRIQGGRCRPATKKF